MTVNSLMECKFQFESLQAVSCFSDSHVYQLGLRARVHCTNVLKYIFCTHDVLVLIVLINRCIRTQRHSKIGCTHNQILSRIQVLLLKVFPVIENKLFFYNFTYFAFTYICSVYVVLN